jgi:hypothetical protein
MRSLFSARPSLSRRQVLVGASGACGLALVVGVLWLVVTGLIARSQLDDVKSELPQLRQALTAGDYVKARDISHDLATHAHRAHDFTTGPAWWVAANIPLAGTPLQTARTIATQTDHVGDTVLPGVLQLTTTLTSSSLRQGDHIDLNPIATAEPVLATATAQADSAAAAIGRASTSSWLPMVDSARSKVLTDLDKLSTELAGATRAVQTLLPMMGQSTPQRYFIGFENEAEARGLGGLPGAFAIVTADHGQITFTHFENDTALDHVDSGLDLGADFTARYGVDNPTGTYENSDISPNFPYAGQIWAAMWQKKSGEHVDGSIAVDPTALSYLLKVTGPARLPDGSPVSAQNVVALTQQTQYSKFSSDAERKAYVVAIAKAVSNKLTKGDGNTVDLVRAISKAAGQRRIVVWSADAGIESNIVAAGYGGLAQGSNRPFAGFVVVNAAGSKLDYYLSRTMSYRRTGCGAGSTAVASFTLTNDAPASGLPPYVTIRADQAPAGAKPGDNRLLVTYYASQGATISSVVVDGAPQTVASAAENGLVTVSVDLELPVAATATMTVTVHEPPATQPVEILNQPLVRPMTVTTSGSKCG